MKKIIFLLSAIVGALLLQFKNVIDRLLLQFLIYVLSQKGVQRLYIASREEANKEHDDHLSIPPVTSTMKKSGLLLRETF